ncbi:hypothetical protein [Culturomica massiliensis]|uniref:hypothetical protein n=1 Tax=Culturomica massiliensis TaxID=1841857 RepID=UPI0008380A4D|nr:hypothetical protein [Culturomica massiliensis]
MNVVKNICVCLVLALAFNVFEICLKSSFIDNFMTEQIIGIQLSLMAITIATYTFIISKLEELSKEHPDSFNNTYKALKGAMIEQLYCIGISVVLLILKKSEVLRNIEFQYFNLVINTLISTVFIYAIDILKDVGLAVFILIDAFKKIKNK